MMIDWKRTGMKIKKLMGQQEYSLGKMAKVLCISESTMKNYIYARTKIPIEALYCMKEIFGFEKIEDLLVIE